MNEIQHRHSILGIIGGLMAAEDLDDVHDEINLLCDLAGISRPDGDFKGWTEEDWERIKWRKDGR